MAAHPPTETTAPHPAEHHAGHSSGPPPLNLARTPRSVRRWVRLVVLLLLVTPAGLALMPWQQVVHGEGRAIAFNPVERPQFVVAPIQGRIVRWAVPEGKPVRAGDLLVEMVDVDPLLPLRLQDEEFAVLTQQSLALGAVEEVERRITNLELSRDQQIQLIKFQVFAQINAVTAADLAISAAEQPLEAARQALANFVAANMATPNVVPQQQIIDQRASVNRQEELLKQLKANKKQLEEQLNAVRKSEDVTRATANAQIDGERASANRARGDVENLRRQLLAVQNRISRQRQQNVFAPTDGTVFRILENGEAGGQLVNPGQRLANLVPDVKTGAEKERATAEVAAVTFGLLAAAPLAPSAGPAQIAAILSPPELAIPLTRADYPGIVCELMIDGNDLPLVRVGDATVLQFEGWPAVQFVGVPEAATGTFNGRVYLIDPTSNERGQFRILIEPDPASDPWPNQELLRQGVRAQGWVLMPERVKLGWEVWRQINGFPPFREPTVKKGASGGPVTRK